MADGSSCRAEDEPGPRPSPWTLLPVSHPPLDQWVLPRRQRNPVFSACTSVKACSRWRFSQPCLFFQATSTWCLPSLRPFCGTEACPLAWASPLLSRCCLTWLRCSPSTSTASTCMEPGELELQVLFLKLRNNSLEKRPQDFHFS